MTRPGFAPGRTLRILEFGMVFYLCVFAVEGPIRLVQFLHGWDDAMVLRDAVLTLLMVPTFFFPGLRRWRDC